MFNLSINHQIIIHIQNKIMLIQKEKNCYSLTRKKKKQRVSKIKKFKVSIKRNIIQKKKTNWRIIWLIYKILPLKKQKNNITKHAKLKNKYDLKRKKYQQEIQKKNKLLK